VGGLKCIVKVYLCLVGITVSRDNSEKPAIARNRWYRAFGIYRKSILRLVLLFDFELPLQQVEL
jgi:hypothetical protein